MKYLEQRIEELEREVKLLKAKNKLEETKLTGILKQNDVCNYLNHYPPAPDWKNKEINDYMVNPSVNLMSEPDLETAFASPWDSSEIIKNPLDTVTVYLSSTTNDTYTHLNYTDCTDCSGLSEYCPSYPDITGSWDNKNFNDVINENVTDDYGFKMNHEEPITTWGFESEFDKQDKNFLNYLNSTEKKIEREFGEIISRFKILTHEWEMDGYGYIVRDNNTKKVILTNHNKPFIVDKNYLKNIISGYKETIQETERALFLIK